VNCLSVVDNLADVFILFFVLRRRFFFSHPVLPLFFYIIARNIRFRQTNTLGAIYITVSLVFVVPIVGAVLKLVL
jgi:hypothetical protein